MTTSAILVLGNYCQTITVVRSLSKAGYYVIVGRDAKRVYSQYSRHVSEVWCHPDIAKSEEQFIADLGSFLAERRDVTLVFPVGETEILALMRHRQAIPPNAGLVMADSSTIEICFDKIRIYEIVSALGVPCAEFQKVSNYPELESAIGRMGYPCVVKPNNSQAAFFGMKAMILKTAADSKMLPAWPEGNDFLILQKFAPGYRHNCHIVADRGRMLAYFEQRVLRTDTPDGAGSGVHGISYAPTAKLREYCIRLLQKLEYSGAGCAQFLVDDQSRAVNFLEINPRLDATCAVPFYCGYDFPRMAVQYTEYRQGVSATPPENAAPYTAGKHGVSLWRDVLGWRQAIKAKKLGWKGSREWLMNTIQTFIHADIHLTWRWNDPLPTCYRYSKIIVSALAYIIALVGFGAEE